MTKCVMAAVLAVTLATPARAQLVVIDPENLAQAVLIAERTLREYQTLLAQYETIVRMSRGVGSMDGYRVPTIATTGHDVARWEFGRSWLQGLNSGDPDGAAYAQTVRRLERPGRMLEQLPPSARRTIEQGYATVEISDSAAMLGGHQVALVRGYSGQLQQAINALEGDVLNRSSGYRDMTAVLDKIAGGALIARLQDTAANQLLSHTLEQLLVRSKRLRDAEAATMNMRLGGLQYGQAAGASIVRGAADDLRSWRQP